MAREEVEIASVGYRLVHWLNLIFFMTLLLTGLILLELEVFSFLAYPIGAPLATLLGLEPGTGSVTAGVQVTRLIHRLVGPVWGALLVAYTAYILASGRSELIRPFRRPLGQQVREAIAVLKHYILGSEMPEDVRANMDRHNVLVSYVSVLLVVGVILLGMSGLSMAYLSLTPSEHRLMLLLHDIGFYLSLVFLIAHIFATFHPTNVILIKAMFGDGKVPLRWAEEHMPAYIRRVRSRA